MLIGDREIGPAHPPYIIAEIGVNHDGSVERALELTDAAADAGADAVKLQYFETDRLLGSAAKLAAYQRSAGETDPVAMLRRLELSLTDMQAVVERAHARGLHAIVTVFSVELVEPAARLPWDAFKSASPDIVNRPLLDAMADTGRPLIVSTGASDMDEVVRAVGWLELARPRLALLQCVSCYPAPEAALGAIRTIEDATGLPVGYSDHTKEMQTAWYATAAGACIHEKHITHSPRAPGPDHAASVHVAMFGEYCRSARATAELRPVCRWWQDRMAERGVSEPDEADCDEMEERFGLPKSVASGLAWRLSRLKRADKRVLECERDVRTVSRQSLTTVRALPSGHALARGDLTIKRPGTGLAPWRLDEVVGRRLARDVGTDTPLLADDLAPE